METVIVESTVLVEQKPLTTTHFYLLHTTLLVETTVIVEQKTPTVFSIITVFACTGKKHLTLSRHSQLKYRLVQNTPQLLENLSGLTSISVHMFLLEGEQLRKKVLAANSLYSKAKSVLIEKSRKGKLSAEEMERSVTLVDRINDNRLKVFNQVFG